LHIDASELPKFSVPGHWATGERAEHHKTRRAGTVKVIGVIDDHTRLAYCELHGAENKHTVSATLRRAADWFTAQGCEPVQAVISPLGRRLASGRAAKSGCGRDRRAATGSPAASPKQLTSLRADGNRWMSPTEAMNVAAGCTLTPGTVVSRSTSGQASACLAISRSIAAISQRGSRPGAGNHQA
jgi:hypothetical protein